MHKLKSTSTTAQHIIYITHIHSLTAYNTYTNSYHLQHEFTHYFVPYNIKHVLHLMRSWWEYLISGQMFKWICFKVILNWKWKMCEEKSGFSNELLADNRKQLLTLDSVIWNRFWHISQSFHWNSIEREIHFFSLFFRHWLTHSAEVKWWNRFNGI